MNNTLDSSFNVNNVVVVLFKLWQFLCVFFAHLLHNVTSDAQFWHVPIMGMMRSMCTLFNNRDINGTKPNFRIASLFGLDSDSE